MMQLTPEKSNQIDRYLTGKMSEEEARRFEVLMQLDAQLAEEVELQGYAARVVQLEGRQDIRELLAQARDTANQAADTPPRYRIWSLIATLLLLMVVSLPLLRDQLQPGPHALLRVADVDVNGFLFQPGDPGGIPVSHIEYQPEGQRFYFVGHDRQRFLPIPDSALVNLFAQIRELALPARQTIWLASWDREFQKASYDFSRRLGYKPPQEILREDVNEAFADFKYIPEPGSEAESAPGTDFYYAPCELAWEDTDPMLVPRQTQMVKKVYPRGGGGRSPVNAWLPQPGQVSLE